MNEPLLRIRAPRWDPSQFQELGRGGEAVVYRLKPDTVAKVFLLPNTPEFTDQPHLQEAAQVRIKEMQRKVDDIPRDLPPTVVTPTGVLVNGKKQVFGYTMPFVKGVGLDQLTRRTGTMRPTTISDLLTSLHDLLTTLHGAGVVVGDLNEHNIIVAKQKPHIIDTDAMQFGLYQCRTFTPRFTAPELLRAEQPTPSKNAGMAAPPVFSMVAPHTEHTDWYSFLVIVMRLLTCTDPFGGVVKKMDLVERLERRVTVFDRRVTYPAIARPLTDVPRPILEVFFRVFHGGERFVPDRALFTLDVLAMGPAHPILPVRKKGTKNHGKSSNSNRS